MNKLSEDAILEKYRASSQLFEKIKTRSNEPYDREGLQDP